MVEIRLARHRRPREAGRAGSRGFTLIELLVVMAVIALLIAVLLPALEAARVQARVIECSSQMRQILTAAHAYANDYDGHWPEPPHDKHTWPRRLIHWGPRYAGLLFTNDYIAGSAVLWDPAMRIKGTDWRRVRAELTDDDEDIPRIHS